MSYYLFVPDPHALEAAGYRSIRHAPVVFSPTWQYDDIPSRYLREKARLEILLDREVKPVSQRFPTRRTLITYGQSLCNFLEWCEARSLAWKKVSFAEHLLDGYQGDMLSGRWAERGNPLRPRTSNLRVTVAIEFLRWAAWRGLRDSFQVPITVRSLKVPTHQNSHGYLSAKVNVRPGVVRPSPIQLRIPTDSEIKAWRDEIRIKKGATKLLMIDLILSTGIRREEAVQWSPETLPTDPGEWRVRGDYITVTLKHGTKGNKFQDADGLEMGPPRNIDIPRATADRLHHYATFARPALAAKFVREGDPSSRLQRRQLVKRHFFLSDHSGTPISGATLYDAWALQLTHLPFRGWSVHGGRHYWACKTLMDRVGQVWNTAGRRYDLTTSANDVILLHIQPQLGHVSTETTLVYLTWLERMFVGTAIFEEYADSLDSICTTEEPHGEA